MFLFFVSYIVPIGQIFLLRILEHFTSCRPRKSDDAREAIDWVEAILEPLFGKRVAGIAAAENTIKDKFVIYWTGVKRFS